MSKNDQAFKYRIDAHLYDERLAPIRQKILDEMRFNLRLSPTVFTQKLHALQGQSLSDQRFSILEMHIILSIFNRYLPYRKPLSIEQMYMPGSRVGA